MPQASYFSGILQVKAYRVLQYEVSLEVKKFGLNPTQWFILGLIREQKDVRAVDIATLLRVEAPLVTNLTEELVAGGLIKKVADKADKRAKLLELTPKGLKLIPQVETSLQAKLKGLLGGVSDNELRTYQKVLEAIVKNGQAL